MYADSDEFSKQEKKQFADKFSAAVNNGRPNPNTSTYITRWVRRLIGNDKLAANYPMESLAPFKFVIGARSALLGINYGFPWNATLKTELSKRIIFRGKEYRDPQLRFYSPASGKYMDNFHPMLGLIKNAPVDYPMNSGVLRHSIVTGVICPIGYENIFLALYPVLINGQRRSTMLIFLYHFPDFSKHLKLVSICRSQLQTSGKALMQ